MLKLENIYKAFDGRQVFSDFSVEFREHTVTCILGRSGVGKTTLIDLLAGLKRPERGSVSAVNDAGERLAFSYVFQQPRLLPWLNVHDNLDLVLKGLPDKPPKQRRQELISNQLKLVGLSDYEFSDISKLSGGMVQRVSLCRAFLFPSDVVLLDEPFKEMDEKLRDELYQVFFSAYGSEKTPRTAIFVTHDIGEALRLAERVLVLSGEPARLAGSFEKSEFTPQLRERLKQMY